MASLHVYLPSTSILISVVFHHVEMFYYRSLQDIMSRCKRCGKSCPRLPMRTTPRHLGDELFEAEQLRHAKNMGTHAPD